MTKWMIYLIAAFLLIATQGWSKSFWFEYQKNIEVPENVELVISNTSGRIEITGMPVSVISISATKNVRATDQEEAEEVAEHIEIKARKTGRRITIQTRYLKMINRSDSFWKKLLGTGSDSFGSVDYTISVPHGCDVDIDNTSGDVSVTNIARSVHISGSSGEVRLENIEGDIDIESLSGNISIHNVKGDIEIAVASSDMELSSITGAVDIRATSGNKRGEYISGPVKISQTSGNVELKYLDGDLRFKSTSGDISVEQDGGAVDILTHSGDVRIKTELLSEKDFFVETTSGNILFIIPELSSGTAKLETKSGNISTDLPLSIESFSEDRIHGSFGKGGPGITLITSSGNITIAQY